MVTATIKLKKLRTQMDGALHMPPQDLQQDQTSADQVVDDVKFRARNVDVFYGDTHAIKAVAVDININEVTAFIGPSGCGNAGRSTCHSLRGR